MYKAAVITVSDKGYAGLREDASGPAVCAMLEGAGWDVVYTAIIPDEAEAIKSNIARLCDERNADLVITTGGTGFSPRDVTPEATLAVVERKASGIAEAMRAKSMEITPRGCLSRGEAGIRGRSLVVNLPGSPKAATENLGFVLEALSHGVEMLKSGGSADCADGNENRADAATKKSPPSMDEWLKEAREHPDAEKCGMYLVHNGTVRKSARARVREGSDVPDTRGMIFSYDGEKVAAAERETLAMPGIYYVRTWLNSGELAVGEDIMRVMVAGDIRPNVIKALDFLVGVIKSQCVAEREIFEE
ncbi:MAG: molybdopterin-binding protein [Clostridia bacterium]|nr:molybdopterin-binding protein [Clostridia bacterium]